MVERLVTNLAMRKAKVRYDGIEPGHLVAPGHRLDNGRRSHGINRSRAGVRADGALRERKGGQDEAGDELPVLPRHRPIVYFNASGYCLRLCPLPARLFGGGQVRRVAAEHSMWVLELNRFRPLHLAMLGGHLRVLRVVFLMVACLPAAWSAAAAAQHSPYAGETTRAVKALSDQEIADYLSGKGMGFAKAAELNGYPGPAHVLELATDLRLTSDQRARTQQLFNSMQADAISVGRALVDRERELDASFAQKAVTPRFLAAAVGDIASLQGRLRDVHLQAHLAQTAILTPEQIRKYDELSGYREGAAPKGHHHRGH